MNGTLHIYGQGAWHDDVWIVGDRAALNALARAVAMALFRGIGDTETMATDGEGYGVHVRRMAEDAMINKLAMPYTDDCARDGQGVDPAQFFAEARP